MMLACLKEDPIIRALYEAVPACGCAVYLVGGALRDAVLYGAPGRDFDFVLDGGKERVKAVAETLARKLGGSPFLLDKERGAYRVALPGGFTVDLAVLEGGGITEDLLKRDFTVDAMAVDLRLLFAEGREVAGIIDPTGGLEDARKKLLRMLYPKAFEDDPLRALRAVRLVQQCGLGMTEETVTAVKTSAGLLKRVSVERVRDELLHIFRAPATAVTIETLYDLGLLEVILPWTNSWRDVQGYDLLLHARKAVAEAEAFPSMPGPEFSRLKKPFLEGKVCGIDAVVVLKLAAFLHDAGKPATIEMEGSRLSFMGHDKGGAELVKKALKRLKFGKKASALIVTLTERHHRVFELAGLKEATRRAKSRFFTSSGDDAGLMLLALAVIDARATRGEADADLERFANCMVDFYFDEYVQKEPRRLLSGREIMAEFGVKEGAVVGEIMALIAEGEEAGVVKDRPGAVEYARDRLKARGFKS